MMSATHPIWNWFSVLPIMPELFLAIAAIGLLMVGVFQKTPSAYRVGVAMLVATLFTIGFVGWINFPRMTVLNNMVVIDGFARHFKFLILGGFALSLCLSLKDLKDQHFNRFEIPVIMAISTLGMMLMVSANNLLSLYVSLELQSLALYVLASVRRDHVSSSEAGLKYFILGALSSGLLLFGMSLIYGYAGSIDFDVLSYTFVQNQGALSVGVIFGLAFILAGLAFKVSAVPFHMWAPDVYQGAPHFITAFFAIVPKVAAFGLLIRVLAGPFAPAIHEWSQIILFLSIASMVVGGFAGVAQSDFKRLLAYSSIGNMGYALMGLLSGTPESLGATILYLTLYMIATAGTFGLFLLIYNNDTHESPIAKLSGLSKQHPLMAYGFAILLFSVAGIPPFAGFFGKLFVFQSVVEGGFIITAVIGVLASVVSAYYYIRLIKIMFFDEPQGDIVVTTCNSSVFIIALSIFVTVLFILFPNYLLHHSMSAAQNLFGP